MKNKKIRLGKWDRKWAAIVRDMDGRCVYCHSSAYLAAHHIKGRSCKSTRFLYANGITLCPAHHVFSSEFSAHKTPEKFERWFKKEFPERWKVIREKAKVMMSEREAISQFEALIK